MIHVAETCPRFDPEGGSCQLIDQRLGWDAQASPATCRDCLRCGGPSDPASEKIRDERIEIILSVAGRVYSHYPAKLRRILREKHGITGPEPKERVPPDHLAHYVAYARRNACAVNKWTGRAGPKLRDVFPEVVEAALWTQQNG